MGGSIPLGKAETVSATRYWIFQANPSRYAINDSLRREREEWWNLNQHASLVKPGDRVAIWLSGDDSGIYAIGTIIEGPVNRADSTQGQRYWTNPADGKREKPRVKVHYDQVIVNHPLYKAFLEADPQLWDLRVIRFPRGTNFPMTTTEWSALKEWLPEEEKP